MMQGFSGKLPHQLWKARDAEDFLQRFATETGVAICELVESVVTAPSPPYVCLGGSIAQGFGNPVSDVDLLVVVDSTARLESARSTAGDAVFTGSSRSLIACERSRMVGPVEVDLQIIRQDYLQELITRLCEGTAAFIDEELRVVSRLATGWSLVIEGSPRELPFDHQDNWRDALRMFCTTRDLLFAQKCLEDAREEIRSLPSLSMHLLRQTAEYAFRSLLASRGFPALGHKWIRLLAGPTALEELRPLWTRHSRVLFPGVAESTTDVEATLAAVERFLGDVLRALESDSMIKIALQITPQINLESLRQGDQEGA